MRVSGDAGSRRSLLRSRACSALVASQAAAIAQTVGADAARDPPGRGSPRAHAGRSRDHPRRRAQRRSADRAHRAFARSAVWSGPRSSPTSVRRSSTRCPRCARKRPTPSGRPPGVETARSDRAGDGRRRRRPLGARRRLKVEDDAERARRDLRDARPRRVSAADEVQRGAAALVSAGSHETSTDRLGIAKGFEALVRLHRREQPPSDEAIAMLRSMVSLTPPGVRVAPDPVSQRPRAPPGARSAGHCRGDRRSDPRSARRPIPTRRSGGWRCARAGERRERRRAADAAGSPIRRRWCVSRRCAPRARAVTTRCVPPASSERGRRRPARRAGRARSAGRLRRLDGRGRRARAHRRRSLGRRHAARLAPRGARARRARRRRADARRRRSPAVHRVAHLAAADVRGAGRRHAEGSRRRSRSSRADDDDNVREAAIDGLVKVAGHAADAVYVGRADAQRLSGGSRRRGRARRNAGPGRARAGAEGGARSGSVAEGRDNSHDARSAIAKTLTELGSPADAGPPCAGRDRDPSPS